MKTDTTKLVGDVPMRNFSTIGSIRSRQACEVRNFIETMIEEGLHTALSWPRYGRRPVPTAADNAATPIVGHALLAAGL